MKRIIAWSLLLTVLLTPLSVLSEDWAERVTPAYDYQALTVGNPTPLEGNFFTDMWGNNTSDLDVRLLLHGYNLIVWNGEEGMFAVNPTVVSGIAVVDNEAGDRTYYLSLYSDLRYSDGSPITARDYAFSYLFCASPVIAELGGKPLRAEHVLGMMEYAAGESEVLTGVRVLDDRQLSVTVRHEYLPFFYELSLLDCQPYPIAAIAPGCEVRDEGEGAFIEGEMSAALLIQTVLDPATGYLSHPGVTSGPYRLTSFEGDTAEFEINPYFKGDQNGLTPMIERLTLTRADNTDMVERLRNGELGLLNKVTQADTVQQAMALSTEEDFTVANYPRVGLTLIAFCCEKAGVSSQAVRQAIAHCLDKDALVSAYVGNYGIRADGYYGLGQWMYQLLTGTVAYPVEEPESASAAAQQAYEAELSQWEALSLDTIPQYALDIDEAERLLAADGWTLGADGVRVKEIDGTSVALRLQLAYPEGNRIRELLEEDFAVSLRQIGIELTFVPLPMEEVLDVFYRRTERDVDMIYLGTNFDVVFDPSAHFQPGENGTPTWNYTEAADEELYELAVSMRQTEPGDVLTYCQRWLIFQQRLAEVEPIIPIYSNVYFDVYPRILHQYNIAANAAWPQAIVASYLSDAEEAEDDWEDGEDFFFD
ncbi:MAG: ABC transporter substrate-binding protein [Clostridia bacterium]|nr:ABC transporter substrate-binding protein [Clostridia bacterium]